MLNVQLIGETCTDRYIYGRCPRLSPEAPVPVFIETKRVEVPGMAGNVAFNLAALGAARIQRSYQTAEIIRTRYVEEIRNHPLLRVDDDPMYIVPFDWDVDLSEYVVVSDYNKGFLLTEDLDKAKTAKLAFIDTKRPLGPWCQAYHYVKINQHEFEASRKFIEENRVWLDVKLIVTLGRSGTMYCGQNFPVEETPVFDVTGAGDTFFAAFVAKYCRCLDAEEAIIFANKCARSVVSKRGTSVVDISVISLL